jgi:hypothetical protein
MAICKATRNDGTPCRAQTATAGELCFWHDPARRAEMLQAAQRGGARRTVELPEGEALTPQRARGILAGVIEAAASGAMDSGTARTVGYLLQIEARIREGHEMESRIKTLESILQSRKG